MLYIVYIIGEIIYHLFLSLIIQHFHSFSMIGASNILFIFSLLLGTFLIYLSTQLTNRKKYFIISSFYIIIICSIFYLFGKQILGIFNIKSGIIHFTMYLYKILFMLSPFFSIYFLSIHKLIYLSKKRQIYFTIILRRVIMIFIGLVCALTGSLSTILYSLSITECLLNYLPLLLNTKNTTT